MSDTAFCCDCGTRFPRAEAHTCEAEPPPAPMRGRTVSTVIVDERLDERPLAVIEALAARLEGYLAHADTCPCLHCAHLRAQGGQPDA